MATNLSGKQFVIDFLNQLKLKPSKNFRQFWNDLEYKHGRRKIDMLKQAVEHRIPGATTNEIYVLKNQNLELSLDFAKYSADLYRRFFDWLVARPRQRIERWLDVGCDNGIVTCFIASLFPEAEVVGVDIEGNAIACAVELANRLGLTNVRFFQSDILNLNPTWDTKLFDRILSVRSFHEILGELGNPPHHWSTQELLGRTSDAKTLDVLHSIHDLLRDDCSELITFERLPWMSSTAMWAIQLQESGLYVDWDKAEIINFQEVGEIQEMPLLICGLKSPDRDILEGLYRLYLAGRATPLVVGTEYEDALAEALLYRFTDKRFVSGVQINFPENTKMRYELWRTEEFVILYQYTNVGNRKLNVLSVDDLPNAMRDFQVTLPTYYQKQGHEVEIYQFTVGEC